MKPRDEAFDFGSKYRGYRYFDKYEKTQLDTLVELINHLCDKYQIDRKVPDKFLDYYGDNLKDFNGIIGHTMVREDKSDPAPDMAMWNRLVNECNLKQVKIQPYQAPGGTMTKAEIDALFEHNVQQIDKMNIAAGGMVRGLIGELERDNRNTYIKLSNPVQDGHTVKYTFVEGDRSLIESFATALGFKSVTDDTLEVRSA